MGLRGPPPTPTKLRLLAGNLSKRRLPKDEPQPIGLPVKPSFVTGEAGKEWDRAIGAMPAGLYTAADVPVLTVYCVSWVLFRNALAQVAREGMTAIGSMGQVTSHPQIAVAAKQSEITLRSSDRLGMSPVARTRLTLEAQDAGGGKFAGLFGRDRPGAA